MTYGERIRHYREALRMTQESLGHETGIVASSISKIEHGKKQVTFDEAVRLAKALEVRLQDLAGNEDGADQICISSTTLAQWQLFYVRLRELLRESFSLEEALAHLAALGMSFPPGSGVPEIGEEPSSPGPNYDTLTLGTWLVPVRALAW